MLENQSLSNKVEAQANYIFLMVDNDLYRTTKQRYSQYREYMTKKEVIDVLNNDKNVVLTKLESNRLIELIKIITSNFDPYESIQESIKRAYVDVIKEIYRSSLHNIVRSAASKHTYMEIRHGYLRGAGKTSALVDLALDKNFTLIEPNKYNVLELQKKYKDLQVTDVNNVIGKTGKFIFDEGVNLKELEFNVGVGNVITGFVYKD